MPTVSEWQIGFVRGVVEQKVGHSVETLGDGLLQVEVAFQ